MKLLAIDTALEACSVGNRVLLMDVVGVVSSTS
jgi:tRNA A37 threonylcarbamoyladenosine modification protein TsaB